MLRMKRFYLKLQNDYQDHNLCGCGAGNILREVGPGLILKDLSIVNPNSHSVLCRDLNLHLAPGESLLVMGPSGCGKSSLLRAIAGKAINSLSCHFSHCRLNFLSSLSPK